MKFEKLKEIYAKVRKVQRYEIISFIGVIIGLLPMVIFCFLPVKPLFPILSAAIFVISAILLIIFGCKESEYYRQSEEYIVIRISELIEKEGYDNFELIKEGTFPSYIVAFRNQQVKYDDLQEKIDSMLYKMNKIANQVVRVRLI